MTATTRSLARFGLLCCLGACADEPVSSPTPSGKLAPVVDAPVLAAVAEPDPAPVRELDAASEDDVPPIYAKRPGPGTADAPDTGRIQVGGTGPYGIHLDSLVVGRGFSNSRCETETHEFEVETDERVNLCLRVIHGGHTEEFLTVKWTRDGRGPKATRLSLRNSNSYRTRAWLPLRDHSEGDWHVSVTASDGSVLGEADFTVRGREVPATRRGDESPAATRR